ncbi:MAG: hypothetical protein CM15mP120_06130 [Pseudomonadota bacterium]|nr:MAG: hypothetical protein CM15mP120_06130 [Pseudomonadota bacterium]
MLSTLAQNNVCHYIGFSILLRTIMNPDLVWIDLEMTGLDASKDRIIEMATITDSELHLIAEGPVLAIQQPQSLLGWCWTIEPKSFGFGIVRAHSRRRWASEREAEAVSLAFIEQTCHA